jgi:ribose 5-phosphate isomerase B
LATKQQNKNMRIVIGGDHAGFPYKDPIATYLREQGCVVIDKGTNSLEAVDYPDFAHEVAKSVIAGESDLGIVLCGSGNGVAITVNKYAKIRAALCWTAEIAKLARQHNDANILALPVRFISLETAIEAVEVFCKTSFEGGRHQTRVDKIAL